MCDNGKYFFLLYKINYNIFELHYSLQKEPKLKKEQTNAVKRHVKARTKSQVEKWVIVMLLIPHYKVLQENAWISTRSLVSIFFTLKFFNFCFFELNIFFKFSNSGIRQFTAECLFSTPFYKVSIKMFTRSARISRKRFAS